MTKAGEAEPQLSDEKKSQGSDIDFKKHNLVVMNSIGNFKGKANCYVTWLNVSAFEAKLSLLHKYIYQ
jgi:hypothetical protein